jgi:hypothetical protein
MSGKLNRATELRVALVSNTDDFVVPVVGARVVAGRLNGHETFSGYVVGEVEHEYLGYGEKGPIYRYKLVVLSDESSLDQRTIPLRPPFVARAAGEALRCLTDSLLPDAFDTTAMENGDFIGWYACRSGKRWSDVAADMAILSRASYRVDAEGMRFAPVGSSTYALDESADNFSPSGLTLRKTNHTINDLTVIGNTEPSMYVKDYFVGDGFSLKFYLSQVPFTRSSRTLVDEEYSSFDSSRWLATDPSGVVSISGGKLVIAGGDGVDGATRLEFSERMELAGALILQHGDIQFQGCVDCRDRWLVRRQCCCHRMPGGFSDRSCWCELANFCADRRLGNWNEPDDADRAPICVDDACLRVGGVPNAAAIPLKCSSSGSGSWRA